MCNYPYPFAAVLSRLKFINDKLKRARDIRISGVNVVEEIASIPEVRVESDDPQTIVVLDRICAVMRPRLRNSLLIDPPFMLP